MEEAIIKAGAKGDTTAFRKIFNFYLPKMRPVVSRYMATTFETDDVLQEAFLKVFHGLKDYEFRGSFEGWLKKIVINTALNHYKKSKSLLPHSSLEEVEEEILGSEEIAEEAEPALLLELLKQLPDGYKIVMNLYVLEDYSHKEISEILNISEGTSRSQYSKARKMLYKMLLRQRNAPGGNLHYKGEKK